MESPSFWLDLNNISPWWAIIVSLIGNWTAYHFAVSEAAKQQRSLHLDESRATPNIGSRATVELAGRENPHTMAVKVIIYNDGDLIATNLEGTWKVVYNSREHVRTIRADGLPRFLPINMQHDLHPVGQPASTIRVEINFSYYGMNNSPKSYKRAYESENDPKELVQVKDVDQPHQRSAKK